MANEGRESTFNEASLKMERLHDSQKLINSLSINTLMYNPVAGKYNYEVICSEYLNLLHEVYGKLGPAEKKTANRWRDLLIDSLETFQVFSVEYKDSFEGLNKSPKLNNENWKKLRNFIFAFGDHVRDLLEKHGYSSPNAEEEAGWD